jgi:integrase
MEMSLVDFCKGLHIADELSVREDAPATPSQPRNFAELHEMAKGWTHLKPPARSVMCSNIKTVGRAALTAVAHRRGELGAVPRAHVDLRAVPCDPAWLNRHVFSVTAAMLGIKGKSTLGGAVSGLRGALRHVGLLDAELPSVAPDGPWRNLLDAMLKRGSLYGFGLTAFAAWCERDGIAPRDVNAAVLKRFEHYITNHTLRADIPGLIRGVAKAWRVAQSTITDLPNGVLQAPARRQRYVMALTDFSESFQRDVTSFEARLSGKGRNGPFRGNGPARLLRPSSIKSRVFSIRQAATALVLSGWSVESILSLGDLVTEQAAEAILIFYWQRAKTARVARRDFATVDDVPTEAGVTEMTGQIAHTLTMIARHHCGLPEPQLKALGQMADDMTPPHATEISPKNRARVRQFDDPKLRFDLLRLPSRLLKNAQDPDSGRLRHRAVLARTAIGIELLLHTPLRLENLVSLRFGAHLRHEGSQQGRITHLAIPANEMKNARAFENIIAPDLAAKIARYRKLFHPELAPGGSDFLFPAGRGMQGHISKGAMSSQIISTVEKEVGARVNPHLFRHLVVRFTLEDDPGGLEDARQLLGDKSEGIVLAHYSSVEPAAAARRHHERLRRARQAGSLLRPRGKAPK